MTFAQQVTYGVTDTWAVTRRNLLRYVRLPQLLFFSSIQPVMFLLLFNFVFGGAVGNEAAVPGGKYINFLLPGILVQTSLFGGMQTGIGLAEDMGKGIIDRFKSLPMSRGAVLAGRTFSDMIRNISTITIMLIVGSLLGFRFLGGFLGAVEAVAIVVSFSFAFSWAFAFIGMSVKDTETAQLAGFVSIFPLVFASAAFVPVQSMPSWLQVFARNQPVTHAVNAARELALGLPDTGAWWKVLLWVAALLAVFIPLAISRYKSR
jgi:ABC-2 type transport system permease protein/oleandomycin transport system permease protein